MAAQSLRGAAATGSAAQKRSEQPTVVAATALGSAEEGVEHPHADRQADHTGPARHQVEDMPRVAEVCRREDGNVGGEYLLSRWDDLKNALKHKRWVLAYEAEFARELNAQHGRYLRSAGWCIVLALLAVIGAA